MMFPNPEWLDLQYNPFTAIPEAAAILKRWDDWSAKARAETPRELDFRYGPGAKQTLDWFSAENQNAPVLVFIHGGFWRGSDKFAHSFIAPAFLTKGCDVVFLNYDLCPTVSMEALVQQIMQGLGVIYRQLPSRGCDPMRMVVAGHSAGGHLAAMMLTCDWKTVGADLPTALVTRALSISGLFDLEPFRHTPFLKDALRLDEQSVRRLSPVRLPAPAGRILNAVVGGVESDEFHRQTEVLVKAWGQSIVPIAASIAGKNHFTILEDLISTGTPLHDMACCLLGIDH